MTVRAADFSRADVPARLRRVLDRLPSAYGPIRDPQRWVARCPIHPADGYYIKINPGVGGRVALTCTQGCTLGAIIEAAELDEDDVVAEALPDETLPTLALERADDEALALRPRFQLLTVAQLAQIPDPEQLVDGVLCRATLAAIVAKYSSFKSFIALDLALHLAHGLPWHGRTVTGGPVVYVYVEGVRNLRGRIESWRLLNRLPEVGGIHFLPRSVILNEPRDCRDLLTAIAALPEPPVAVFIDTLARTFKGNESAAEDMNGYIAACDRIKDETGATVVLVHHTGWEGTRSRGATNLPGALDTELTLTRDGDRVTVAATKQKDGTEGDIATLEAFPIGDSLAFRAVGPASSALSANETTSLSEVRASPGLSWKAWWDTTGLPKSSFNHARNRLVALAYVKCVDKKWYATEAGAAAIGPRSNAGPIEVQNGRAQ